MADQPNPTSLTKYLEAMSFVKVFRTFRIAIAPGKLGLALLGLLLMGFCGWFLDRIWPTRCQPIGDEISVYWKVGDLQVWRNEQAANRLQRLTAIYQDLGLKTDDLQEDLASDSGEVISEAVVKLGKVYQERQERYAEELKDARGDAKKRDEVKQDFAADARAINATCLELKRLKNRGVFESFVTYELDLVHQLLNAACRFNFLGEFDEVIDGGRAIERADMAGMFRSVLRDVQKDVRTTGVIPSLILMARGKLWMATHYPLFFVLFMLCCLIIWSILGGAICRMAALHFARDERIAPKAAIDFAGRKFLAFLAAPLLPMVMIFGVGICLLLGGLFGAIPYIGELIAGIAMVLAMLGGFVIALIFIGAAAGGSLFWPTIAVEGSDAFDAISRSYSYVYSKPWRAGFYAMVATIYGAICFLFARFFVLVMLKATRFFVGIGMGAASDRPGTGLTDASKLDAMWPSPTFENLMPTVTAFGLKGWEAAGAVFINVWMILTVGLLFAFLVSFYYSGSTVIYFLLRSKVDATDLEDVFEEEKDGDEAVEEMPEPDTGVSAGTPTKPVEPDDAGGKAE
ncbi:MAG: hypothetical protein GXY44_09965 [Phycisphaerales bacterium]|nr:hypothetical protein [Phycisphaerales bacterium]